MILEFKFTDGSALQVGTFYGIGRNYAKHAREMGQAVPSEPIVFIKPRTAFIPDGGKILLPDFSDNIHHELELVVVIGKECRNVKKEDAFKYIAGFAVGLDVTLRDIQNKAKTEGNPWAVSKGFYSSAPVSEIVPVNNFSGKTPEFHLSLKVNGELRQSCSTYDMERPVELLIEYLSHVFGLLPGDAIFTGTPEGVNKIVHGDRLIAELKGWTKLEVDAV